MAQSLINYSINFQITQFPDHPIYCREAVVAAGLSDSIVLPTRLLSPFDQRVTITRSFSQSI